MDIILMLMFELYFFYSYSRRGIFNANSFKFIGNFRTRYCKVMLLSVKKFSTVLSKREDTCRWHWG
jgi:hypothetical protein